MSRLLGVALRSIHSGMSAARIERLAKLVAYLRATRTPRPFSEIRQEDGFDAYAGPVAASGERAFERDKADLLRAGIPIIYVEETDEVGPGYMIDEPPGGGRVEPFYVRPSDIRHRWFSCGMRSGVSSTLSSA